MKRWLSRAMAFALVLPWALPALGQESNICELTDFAPPASFSITQGEITGARDEQTPMMRTIPKQSNSGTRVGHLIAGDKVDFVLACQGFSYVRYHGAKQTTAGWVDSRKLQLHGQPFIPLPPNASQLCFDAQRDANNKKLAVVEERNIPQGIRLVSEVDKMLATPLAYQLINVQGHPLAVVQMSEGGSCYTISAKVWTGNLKRQLSPDDVESRNPINLTVGGNAWAMALSEDAVVVDGHVLIRSSTRYRDFDLSSIDKTGDTQLLCQGRLRPLLGKPVVLEGDPTLCETLPTAATPITMQPAKGKFTVPPQVSPDATQEAVQWGMVDLDNTGHDHPVGVVNYEFSSAAGCGSGFDQQLPVQLESEVVSLDQISSALRALRDNSADAESSAKLLVRIVRFRNQTYVELLDADLLAEDEVVKAPVQSIWKFGLSGPKQICKYQTHHYEVKPPSFQP